jgi:hypothetical protein
MGITGGGGGGVRFLTFTSSEPFLPFAKRRLHPYRTKHQHQRQHQHGGQND